MSAMEKLSPELQRLERGIQLLDELRRVFYAMDDAGERDRAWGFLRDRFAEFAKADLPAWEEVDDSL